MKHRSKIRLILVKNEPNDDGTFPVFFDGWMGNWTIEQIKRETSGGADLQEYPKAGSDD